MSEDDIYGGRYATHKLRWAARILVDRFEYIDDALGRALIVQHGTPEQIKEWDARCAEIDARTRDGEAKP